MAGASDLLSRVRVILAAYDEEALAALANKGLVRRAMKDLEATPPSAPREEGGWLVLHVGDAVVRIAERIPEARCSCPATAICRHILTALLYLKQMRNAEELRIADCGLRRNDESLGSRTASSASPSDLQDAPPSADNLQSLAEAAAIDEPALVKWAGRPLFNKARRALAEGLKAEIRDGSPAQFHFPLWNETVRWMPGAGLEGMLCTCHAPGPCLHRVAALLALQVQRGLRENEPESRTAALEASQGAPRTRAEVLDSVAALLRETIGLGLSRLSSATAQRLRTLATSAHGVDLPRLSAMLSALADEAAALLRRDAQSDTHRLLQRAARIEALCAALARPTPELIGQHRTQYFPIGGTLTVQGLGARQWRSRSGYAGLTLYFWDPTARTWLSWSEARRVAMTAFDPLARYRAAGPWSGSASPRDASRSKLQLMDAWRNRAGRLSGRESMRALPLGAANPTAAPAVSDWGELAALATALFGGGLGEWQEIRDLVILAPAAWGERRYDPIRQALCWPVADAAGAQIELILENRKENEAAIRVLEGMAPDPATRLLGQLQFREGRLCVEPITFYQGGQILNLTLDAPYPAPISPIDPIRPIEYEGEEDDPDEDETPADGERSAIGHLLAAALGELEAIADAGTAALRPLEPLQDLQNRMETLGLTVCAGPGRDFLAAMTELRRSMEYDHRQAARALLRWAYVLRLAATQDSLRLATSSFRGI
jgi:hypothetical protein